MNQKKRKISKTLPIKQKLTSNETPVIDSLVGDEDSKGGRDK
jgi:hypothetical protein